MALVFNMGSQARLEQGIEAADTRILLTSYDTMLSKGGSGDTYYAQMINAIGEKEIVLVDVGNSDSLQGLSVTRGVESTSAQAWGAGTIIWQVMSEASLDPVIQKSVLRQVSYNPNGVLVSDFLGEKVYQTDLHNWWKAVGAASTEWRLIAGEVLAVAPIFSPIAGSYTNDTPITITSSTPGSSIYYTIDGSAPDDTDTLYSASITLPDSQTTTLKAVAYGLERWHSPSNITSGEYTMEKGDWVLFDDLSALTSTTTVFAIHAGYLFVCGDSEKLFRSDGVTDFSQVAPLYQGHTANSLYSFDGDLYGGFFDGQVLVWNGVDAWSDAGDAGSYQIWDMTDDGTYLYAVSGSALYRYSGGTSWSLVAGSPSGVTNIKALTYDGSDVYGGADDGQLYRFTGSAWSAVPGTSIDSAIYNILTYSGDGDIYMGGNLGSLIKHDGSDYSTVAASQGTVVAGMAEISGKIYMVLFSANGNLWEWPGTGSVLSSVASAPLIGSYFWSDCVAFNDTIFACSVFETGYNSLIYEWG